MTWFLYLERLLQPLDFLTPNIISLSTTNSLRLCLAARIWKITKEGRGVRQDGAGADHLERISPTKKKSLRSQESVS